MAKGFRVVTGRIDSSRSCAPLPVMSTTAGCGPGPGGSVSVPASWMSALPPANVTSSTA